MNNPYETDTASCRACCLYLTKRACLLDGPSLDGQRLGCLLNDCPHSHQNLHNLFHFHTARGLHQDYVTLPHNLLEVISRSSRISHFVDLRAWHPAPSSPLRNVPPQRPADNQLRQFLCGKKPSNIPVKRAGLRAEL